MSLCALNSVYIFLNDNNMFRITTVINIYVYIYVPVDICISLYHSYILAEEVFNWLITLAFATLVYALKYLSLSNINNSLSLSLVLFTSLLRLERISIHLQGTMGRSVDHHQQKILESSRLVYSQLARLRKQSRAIIFFA